MHIEYRDIVKLRMTFKEVVALFLFLSFALAMAVAMDVPVPWRSQEHNPAKPTAANR